jgi:hypothetical protein
MSKRTRFFNIAAVALAASALGLLSCSQPFTLWDDAIPGTLRLDMSLTWNDEAFGLGQKGVDHNGNAIRLENLQMYFSRLELRDEAGTWHRLGETHLLDFADDTPYVLEEVPWGQYNAVKFGMGIPPDLNTGIDPASYPNDHPLSVAGSAGMFWTWASGYIFVKYEGKFAAGGTGEPLEPLSYHTGTDTAYREVILDLPTLLYTGPRNLNVLNLSFDAAKCLHGEADSIDVVADPITHSAVGTTLGYRLMDLMDDAWTIYVN